MSIGAVGTLAWGDEPRRLTQRWARAIYEDLPDFRGLRYRSAHQGGLAIAYWGLDPLVEVPGTDIALTDATMLGRVRLALAKQGRVLRIIDPSSCDRCVEAATAIRVTKTIHVATTPARAVSSFITR